MRGLAQAAALLLAPALALAHGHHPPPPPPPPPQLGGLPFALDVTPSAYVTLKVPRGDHDAYSLTFRLDVEESEEVCGPASIRVNGESLKQDSKGHGVGSLYLDNDTIVSAEWDFECIGDDTPWAHQSMRFSIRAMDDMALTTEPSFWMTFKQTTPVRISDIGGAEYVWSLSMPYTRREDAAVQPDKDDSTTIEPPPIWEHQRYEFQDPEEELQVELMELEALRRKVMELEQLISERETSVEKMLNKMYPPPPSTAKMLKQCDGIRCVVHTLTDKVKHTAGRLYGDVFGPRPHHHGHHGPGHHGPGHHGNGTHHGPPHHRPPFPFPGGHPPPPHHGGPPPPPPPPPPPHHDQPPKHRPHHDEPEPGHGEPDTPENPDDKEKDRPMSSGHDDHHRPSDHKHGRPGHHHHDHPPPPPHQPVIMVFGMAAIALAIFCAIGIGYIHRRVARLTPESRRAICRAVRQSRDERRARRGSRGGSALKAAVRAFFARWSGEDDDEEKQAMLREGRRRRTSTGSSVTMEQEIAQFRQAAYMVEGLVTTADEGRSTAQRDVTASQYPHPPHLYSHHARSHSQPHPYAPGPPAVPPRPPLHTAAAAYPGFVVADERLPSYDDDEHDASVVADGCRYTPGSSDYTPSNTASNADDVLGDSKR